MGTNYYLEAKQPCECCNRSYEPMHIGKSSGGWVFLLRIYPDQDINNLDDWLKLLCKEDAVIRNEYGHVVTLAYLIDNILNRSHPAGLQGKHFNGYTYETATYEFS